jgi:uncharacterized protein YbjT (DUF2867 family)
MKVLVTGATGPVGGSVVAHLLGAGQSVRIVTRNRGKAPEGVEVVEGDFTKGDLPGAAFDEVRRVFLFPALGGVSLFLEQAKRAGVERVVLLSSLAAAMEHERDKTSPSALHHLAIEDVVRSSGIPATILRPGTFANNLLFWAHSIQGGDVVYGPYAASAQAPIHEADIAAVAALALTGDGHEGQTYAMTGPESLTRAKQLDAIGSAIGRTLRYQEIAPEAFQQEMTKYMPLPIIKMLLDYWSETVAQPDVVVPTAGALTGRSRTLVEWARDHAEAFGRPRAS